MNSGWLDHAIGFGLALCYFLLLFFTLPQTGIPRDESFYLYAGDRAADWVFALFDEKRDALSAAEIEKGFEYNREHPVLMKMLFGMSHRLLKEKWDLVDNLTAYRMPTVVMAALALWLVYLLGVLVDGRSAGVIAAMALAFMPRVFLHDHLACFDAPVTFMWLLICYTFLRATRSRAWAIACGLCFGLGLATKLNIFFVPFVLFGVAVLDCLAYRRRHGTLRRSEPGVRGPLGYYAWLAVALPVLGLAVFYLHWPWIWSHTVERVGWYLSFHARHVHYPVDYMGHLYFRPPFPVEFPFVYSLLTLPCATLIFGGIGLPELCARALRPFRNLDAPNPDRRAVDALILLNFLVPFLIIALPTTPIFGGIKHWMPAMPFLAVGCGVGAARMADGLIPTWPRFRRRVVGGALAVVLMLPAAYDTLNAHPHGETWFNALAGGRAGGAELGMPRNFWGYSTNGVLDVINERVEKNALVFWHKLTQWGFEAYKRDGLLRKDVRYTGDWTAPYSNWAVYHDQREKLPEELDIWRSYGTEWPVDGLFLGGVQIMAVYQRSEAPKPPPIPPGAR